MKHYSSQEWADFARNVVGKEQKDGMQSHLESGCTKCAKDLGLWQRVHDTARRQAPIQPPDSVVRSAKGMYAIHGLGRARSGKATIAQLMFDSLQSPLPAGVRAASAAPRQLLYGAGNHRIDVRFEPKVDSEKVSLVGQILDSTNPEKGLDALPVVLLRGSQILSESWTNQFGEFHLECNLESGLKLRIRLPHVAEIFIPLIEPVEQLPVSGSDLLESIGVRHHLKKVKKRNRKKG
jgi:hypothetical protein